MAPFHVRDVTLRCPEPHAMSRGCLLPRCTTAKNSHPRLGAVTLPHILRTSNVLRLPRCRPALPYSSRSVVTLLAAVPVLWLSLTLRNTTRSWNDSILIFSRCVSAHYGVTETFSRTRRRYAVSVRFLRSALWCAGASPASDSTTSPSYIHQRSMVGADRRSFIRFSQLDAFLYYHCSL